MVDFTLDVKYLPSSRSWRVRLSLGGTAVIEHYTDEFVQSTFHPEELIVDGLIKQLEHRNAL